MIAAPWFDSCHTNSVNVQITLAFSKSSNYLACLLLVIDICLFDLKSYKFESNYLTCLCVCFSYQFKTVFVHNIFADAHAYLPSSFSCVSVSRASLTFFCVSRVFISMLIDSKKSCLASTHHLFYFIPSLHLFCFIVIKSDKPIYSWQKQRFALKNPNQAKKMPCNRQYNYDALFRKNNIFIFLGLLEMQSF